jgi:hypothetical protein
VIIHGAHHQAMIGTDSRVFVCKPGFMAGAPFGIKSTAWTYASVTGVQTHKGLMGGAVAVQAPGQSGTKTSYWGTGDDDPTKAPNAIPVAGDWERVNDGVARLSRLIDSAHAPTPTSSEQSQPLSSTADELRKLADLKEQRILIEDEFAAEKARLLGH